VEIANHTGANGYTKYADRRPTSHDSGLEGGADTEPNGSNQEDAIGIGVIAVYHVQIKEDGYCAYVKGYTDYEHTQRSEA
jgi:hypothetical protein